MKQQMPINIIGAGLAGLSAAKTCAQAGVRVRLISCQMSERAQSNLAEGGINAALNVMGEDDSTQEHFQDTMKGGCDLAVPSMVRNLTQAAPDIVMEMDRLGVPFHREDGHIVQRNFGGQKKKRTTYAKSSTGKVLTTALIDEVRKYEMQGLVERFPHHRFERLILRDKAVAGVMICDRYTGKEMVLEGPVLMACGGMNGLFAGATTGTTANTGSAAGALFEQGVEFANLEFLQYHPTTVSITGKRLLVSEAARGEGGRLFCYEEDAAGEDAGRPDAKKPEGSGRGLKRYFMEEKYAQRGNLMPRDVISREMAMLGKQAYLDLTALDDKTWKVKLSDLREEIIHYLGIDPACEPVPVSPGIHYFMGGILVDEQHRTNLPGLCAAGECACAYHGANRLGGNSLLGAIYGGRQAAITMIRDLAEGTSDRTMNEEASCEFQEGLRDRAADPAQTEPSFTTAAEEETQVLEKMTQILMAGMMPLRDGESIAHALEELERLKTGAEKTAEGADGMRTLSDECRTKLLLAEATLRCALERRESRGAHTRLDFPKTDENLRKTTVVRYEDGEIRISFREIPQM